jgi:hypothetical protein
MCSMRSMRGHCISGTSYALGSAKFEIQFGTILTGIQWNCQEAFLIFQPVFPQHLCDGTSEIVKLEFVLEPRFERICEAQVPCSL